MVIDLLNQASYRDQEKKSLPFALNKITVNSIKESKPQDMGQG